MERRVVACSRMLETARASVEVGPPHITQGSEPFVGRRGRAQPDFSFSFRAGRKPKTRSSRCLSPCLSLSVFLFPCRTGRRVSVSVASRRSWVCARILAGGLSLVSAAAALARGVNAAAVERRDEDVDAEGWGEGRGGGAETYTVSRVRCLPPGAGSENGRHAHCSTGGSNAGARGAMACTPLHARSFTFTPRRRRLRLDAAGLGKVRNEAKMGRRYARESTGLFEAPLSRVRCTVCYTGALLSVSREDLGEEGKETLLEFAPDFSSY
ncbi:hypothetical protein C8F04DRAFT_1266242 [Mycena alexandri]|uniref:Uncharacterized protein n=1 Tax=Mycena alexandri TaxID=1745969 RepID=A0AAD6SIN9_9AGAR|nr:hypothetical protein C8F04DRAFT_1266242 [Mycena alexandri]